MSRVTERACGEGGEGAFDGSPISAIAGSEPAQPDEMVDRHRPEHQLHRHGAAPATFPMAPLPLSVW
jgi:hypothetical protein